ncbi:MAG: arginine--tRNA ligase [Patescibacteria group bacterium]|jgi:arginyl-tRNA synthetase
MKPVIIDKINEAVKKIIQTGTWPNIKLPAFEVNYPVQPEHGDYAVNVAMKLAKVLQQNPMDIGELIKENLNLDGIERVEVVRPGFINIFVNTTFLAGGVRLILEQQNDYGKNNSGNHKKYLVEFLSANPTGPLHLGNGRGGFGGDVIARVLRASGYDVISEYYVNDYGNQTNILAESVMRRYLQNQGINVDYPEELYKGDYIKELAKQVVLPDVKLGNQAAMLAIKAKVKDQAVQAMIKQIKELVTRKLNIHYDVWKSEKALYENDAVKKTLAWLKERGLTFEQDGAVWFNSKKFGDDKDRVIVKQTGETTYLFSDILYLIDKFEQRKIDYWVCLLGADHHGYQGRMEAAVVAIGHRNKMQIIFTQLVRLMFNGKELRMSKRQGTFVTLEELIEDVGLDVVRWFFLMHDTNTHMDFDLNLAKEHSDKNPVYYVQYAHARICSILAKVPKLAPAPLQFTNSSEESLAKILLRLPELVEEVSKTYQVHKLPQYALEVARAFHYFYTKSRVIEGETVNRTRLQLVQATQLVLKNTLQLMGINAPEKM